MTRRLGRYELVHRLGTGGGGEVWEAVLHGPAGFRRRVAVKLLRDGAGETSAREALVQEARLGALVAHPHVLSTLELGEHEGRWFFVMDLVRGCSASALRKLGPLPPGALLDLGVQTCEGLSHIHGLTDQDGWPLGLVHRDIKPGNLMIDASGQVRIVDLGIARLQGTPELPAGTPGYVAPEQLRGEEGPRADVFSLGVTLTYLAVGRRPFGKGQRAVAQVLDARADARATDPKLLATLDAYLPGLGPVLSRAMRADVESRWRTAEAFGEALRGLHRQCPDSVRLAGLTLPARGGADDATGGLTTERGVFVGRAAELGALEGLLDGGTRWTVLVGPGGVGKTRLVDEVCRAREVVRVDASVARTLPGLCHAVADALGVQAGDDPVASVGRALTSVPLLVVDEIEQVVDAATDAMSAWLAAAPELSILCSSRVALGHGDATVVRVGPMPLVDCRRLFALRLGAEAPTQVVDPLLRTLDRLPLAVELAAARARKTSPERVLAQLRATSSAQVPTLRASLQASWDLLAPEDRHALVRLTSYEGSFDARDAVAVLDAQHHPLERVERLVDHSLLHVRGNRFRLLTSVRAFARAKLPDARRVGEVQHGRWMARHGRPRTLLDAQRSGVVMRSLLDGLDDLMVASQRAATRGDVEVAVGAGLAACVVLIRVGPVSHIGPIVDELLQHGIRRVELLDVKGRAWYSMGRVEEAEACFSDARDLATGRQRSRMELKLAPMRFKMGREGSLGMLQDAIEALEAAGHGPDAVNGRVLLGQLHYLAGRLVAAEHHLRRGLLMCERSGRETLQVRGSLAVVLKRRGQVLDAVATMQQMLDELEKGKDTLLTAVWSVNLSFLRFQVGEPAEAERLAERAARLAREVGRKVTEGLAFGVLSEIALDRGDREEAAARAAEARRVAEDVDDDNLRADVALASGRVWCAQGRREEGMEALEQAWALGIADKEIRVAATLWMARHGDVERALAWLQQLEADQDHEVYLQAQQSLARAEAEWRRGRASECRGSLLQGSAALAGLGIPDHAPLPRSFEDLRRRLAGG